MGKSLTSSQVLRSENFETPCNIKGTCSNCSLFVLLWVLKRKDPSLNKILTRSDRVACHFHSLKYLVK